MEFHYNIQEFLNCDLTGFVLLDSNLINQKIDEKIYKICKIIDIFCGHPAGVNNFYKIRKEIRPIL
jgi:hypothetical protein